MRATDRNRSRKDAEARFPIKIDISVPGSGLGRRLTDILDWCRENVAAGAWDEHRHSERRKGEAPADFARLYFMDEADNEAFSRKWQVSDGATRF